VRSVSNTASHRSDQDGSSSTETETSHSRVRNDTIACRRLCYSSGMSERNGDRARFHKDRKRKLIHRQRIALLAGKRLTPSAEKDPTPPSLRESHAGMDHETTSATTRGA